MKLILRRGECTFIPVNCAVPFCCLSVEGCELKAAYTEIFLSCLIMSGKHWTHSHQLGQRYAAGMGLHFARQAFLDNVSAFNPQTEIRPKVFEVDCGEESTHLGHPCDTESFPCLFNITADPCELYDLSHDPA